MALEASLQSQKIERLTCNLVCPQNTQFFNIKNKLKQMNSIYSELLTNVKL